MAITLSHQSALDVIRTIRCEGTNMHEMDAVPLATPSSWVGKRLSKKNFAPDIWRWQQPTANNPLHIMVAAGQTRVRGKSFLTHVVSHGLSDASALWLDEYSSVVSPELLFLQMAESFSLPALVMLGMELCGHFSRQAADPLTGAVIDGIPAATSVESLVSYLSQCKRVKGLAKARAALQYVCDHAVSAPEAVLATLFGLPGDECGYGMGPVLLNESVQVNDTGYWEKVEKRYPDLMFSFAPVGLNYDGSKHFDMANLMVAAEAFARSDESERGEAREAFRQKLTAVREKVIDDNMRDRQLAAEGRIVFSITKEDLSDGSHLDALARQVLNCARKVFGVEVDTYLRGLDDTALTRERSELLGLLMPHGHFGTPSHGKL